MAFSIRTICHSGPKRRPGLRARGGKATLLSKPGEVRIPFQRADDGRTCICQMMGGQPLATAVRAKRVTSTATVVNAAPARNVLLSGGRGRRARAGPVSRAPQRTRRGRARREAEWVAAGFPRASAHGRGRPLLIAGPAPSQTVTGTIMVCWRESADAARAVTAAAP